MANYACLAIPHSFSKGIHDWGTFLWFIVLAMLQTIMAVDSGLLALDNVSGGKRRFQIVFFVITGLAVIGATVMIGQLGDENQWEASKRAQNAEAAASVTQQQLQGTLNAVHDANRAIDVLSANLRSHDRDGSSQTLIQSQLDSIKALLANAAGTARTVGTVVGTYPDGVHNYDAAAMAQTLPMPVTRASVQNDINVTLGKLERYSSGQSNAVKGIWSSLREMYVMHASQEQKDEMFNGSIGQISGVINRHESDFNDVLPEIEKERGQAL